MTKLTLDEDLQKRLRANDKSALEFIYTSYKSEFLNFCKRYDLSRDETLDIFQDTVIAMYQNFISNKLYLKSSSVKTYLFGIGKHKIFNYLKSKNRHLELISDVEDYQEIEIEESELNFYQQQLAKQLSKISDSCRDLLKLYYYRNLTINEIVEQTHYKDANTVKSHKSRCIKRLKSLLKTQ